METQLNFKNPKKIQQPKKPRFLLLKKFLLSALVLVLILFITGVYIARDTEPVRCYLTGGTMVQRSNTCGVDLCSKEESAQKISESMDLFGLDVTSDVMCGQSFSMSCFCGSGKCWDGSGCVDIWE